MLNIINLRYLMYDPKSRLFKKGVGKHLLRSIARTIVLAIELYIIDKIYIIERKSII